jgi:hypothetical protein
VTAPGFEVIDGAHLPIYSWARDLEAGATAQARNCANLLPAFHLVEPVRRFTPLATYKSADKPRRRGRWRPQ